MSEIRLLPKPKSKIKRGLVLALGVLLIGVIAVMSYIFYDSIFRNKELALTAWAITQGVTNALLSPAKILMLFKA